MESIITDVVNATPRVIEKVQARLPKEFPGDLFDSVTTGLQKAAKLVGEMPTKSD
jgi:serine/threonine-protein kinase HipA